MPAHPLSIIYIVRARQVKNARVVVELVRGDYCKQFAQYTSNKGLTFSSNKQRLFLDEEDEQKILEKCQKLVISEDIGSVELTIHGLGEGEVEVRYVRGDTPWNMLQCATWEPENGLRWSNLAHPVFKGDKAHIARVCFETPNALGGIFKKEEPLL